MIILLLCRKTYCRVHINEAIITIDRWRMKPAEASSELAAKANGMG